MISLILVATEEEKDYGSFPYSGSYCLSSTGILWAQN